MMALQFQVLLFSLVLLAPIVTPDPPDKEKQALLSFIEPLQHDDSYNWNPSQSPCSWKGVICDPTMTTVIQLSLPNAQLVGNLSSAKIGDLSNLLVLSLRGNYLSGSIPSDFSDLQLNELYLNDNYFSGIIPYINSDDLDKFNISGNNLSCRIPSSLSYKFPESAFSRNKDLCGYPLDSCNMSCPYQFRKWGSDSIVVSKRVKVGVSVGVALLLLVILYCFRKKIRTPIKQPWEPSLEAPDMARKGNKLGFFDDGYKGLGWDELVQGSAEVLGTGGFGTSYKRVLVETKMTVVLKRLIKDVSVTKMEFESQMEVLGKMKHENVVPLRGYSYGSQDDEEKWVVYDYMHGGSLSAHLHGLRGARLNWNHRMRIALTAARGVAYLHANNVVHGNIRSTNVLIRQETNKDASVSDYGLNTLFDMWSSPNHWVTGYWAPEVLRTQKFSSKSDVYSFGVLLLELLTGKSPDQTSADQNDFPMWVQFVVCEEPKVEILDMELSSGENEKEMLQMMRIAKDCVSIVPHQRPTMLKVVSMMEEMETVETSLNNEQSKGYIDKLVTKTLETPSSIVTT
ncbi:hypothetical protein E3N88_40848 [Mikania micrantha]|uniref:Protein kinase domain-containing protein n=1 Tax=Mikania micrantha TaxID=192012 RepID=A0A5N6LPS6_9ASTR|nr:hypothetical protein E3N88_40848 [Mikania micrantha]